MRISIKQFTCLAQLILAHFPIDNSLALVKRSSFIDKNAVISVGSEHQVKGGSKVYTAKIIEIGEYIMSHQCDVTVVLVCLHKLK